MNVKKLKVKMAEAGINQAKLASLVGLSNNAISNRFTGKTEFGLEEIEAICRILSINDSNDVVSIFLPDCLISETNA